MKKDERSAITIHLLLSALTGLLLTALFPNFSLGFLAWIALLPLLVIIYEATPKASFFLGWLSGAVFFLGLIYWLLALYSLVNGLAILAWAGLAIFEGLFIGIFAFGAGLIRRNFGSWWRLFTIPALWAGLEFVRSSGFWAFPWGVLGYSQQSFSELTQIVAATGIYGISFLVLLINVALVEIYFSSVEKPKGKLKGSLRYLAVALIILFEVIGSGFILLNSSAKSEKAGRKMQARTRIVAVQGNIAQEEKWDPLKEHYIKKVYYDASKKAENSKPYLIIWPESSVPAFLLHDKPYLSKLESLVTKHGNYLLVGSLHLDSKGRQYNSAIMLAPKSKVVKKYDKLHLVLFGEYVPFKFISDIFQRFKKLSWIGESIQPGREYTVFTTDRGKFSTVICFESGDSSLCRRMVKAGAQALIVITNDAWFGKTACGAQHLQISSFRAIENNLYVVQVANTGISGFVNPQGQIIKKSGLFQRQLLAGDISFRDAKTLYLRWGDFFSYSCLLLAGGTIVLASLRRLA